MEYVACLDETNKEVGYMIFNPAYTSMKIYRCKSLKVTDTMVECQETHVLPNGVYTPITIFIMAHFGPV